MEEGKNNDIDRESSGETSIDEIGVNFVDEPFADINNAENTGNVVINTPNKIKQKDNPIPNGWIDDINWRKVDGDVDFGDVDGDWRW